MLGVFRCICRKSLTNNNQFAESQFSPFPVKLTAAPMQMNCLFTIFLIKRFCSVMLVQIGICFFFFSWKAPLLLLRTQGWISVFCKSSRWFWCRLGSLSRHLPSPFPPRKVWATFSTPLSVKVYILLGFIHHVLVETMCNRGFWDLCGFPAAKILLNLWMKIETSLSLFSSSNGSYSPSNV